MGAAVKALRAALGLSQEDFAAQLDTATLTVGRWENGSFKPNPASLVRLYQLAREKNQSDLAAVFVRGYQVVPDGFPPVPLVLQALPIVDDFLHTALVHFDQSHDPKLNDKQRRKHIDDAVDQLREGRKFIATVLGEVGK